MKFKIVISVAFIFVVLTTNAQQFSKILTFHRAVIVPSVGQYAVSTTSNVDIIFQVISADSVKIIQYLTSSSEKHQTITREEYFGTHKVKGDTLQVFFFDSRIQSKNRLGSIATVNNRELFKINSNEHKFLISSKGLTLLDSDLGFFLLSSTESVANKLGTTFDEWDLKN